MRCRWLFRTFYSAWFFCKKVFSKQKIALPYNLRCCSSRTFVTSFLSTHFCSKVLLRKTNFKSGEVQFFAFAILQRFVSQFAWCVQIEKALLVTWQKVHRRTRFAGDRSVFICKKGKFLFKSVVAQNKFQKW